MDTMQSPSYRLPAGPGGLVGSVIPAHNDARAREAAAIGKKTLNVYYDGDTAPVVVELGNREALQQALSGQPVAATQAIREVPLMQDTEVVETHTVMYPPQPVTQQPGAPETARVRRISPLSSLNKAAPATMQPAVVPPQPKVAEPKRQPNNIHVTFALGGFGELTTAYSDIIVHEGFIVLVFDNVEDGANKFFPSAPSESQSSGEMLLALTPQAIYKVYPTGIQYDHQDKTHCVLTAEPVTLPDGA